VSTFAFALSAVIAALAALATSLGNFYLALRNQRAVERVHVLVNSQSDVLHATIAKLEGTLGDHGIEVPE